MRWIDENSQWVVEQDKLTSGTKMIGDVPRPCAHPSHNPPGHMVYEPGVYEHTCPGCGKKTVFAVQGVYW